MKRTTMIMIATMVIMLWTSIGFADPQWEPINPAIPIETYDVNNVKHLTVGYDEFIKINIRDLMADNSYILSTMLLNVDTKETCMTIMVFYDKDGKVTLTTNRDPKDRSGWLAGDKSTNEIIRRAK